MMKNKSMLFVLSVFLIFAAMAIVSVIDRTKSDATTDVRARASGANSLQFNATYGSSDPTTGTLTVHDLYIADSNREGEAKNLGTWTVTPPLNFNTATLTPGSQIVIGIDPKTFLAQSHSLTALSISER